MKRIVILVFLAAFASAVHAENLDSLEHVLLRRDLTVRERLSIYDRLSWAYLDYDFPRARDLANTGLELSLREREDSLTARLYRNLGVAYTWAGKSDSARMFLDRAIEYAQKCGAGNVEASAYGGIGTTYAYEGRADKALEYYFKALALFEKRGMTAQVLETTGNIGVQYLHTGNYAKAEEYLLRSEKLCTEAGDEIGIAVAASGLADVYLKKDDYERALHYALLSASILHDLGLIADEATALQGVSHVYRAGFKDYAKAIEYAEQALALARQVDYPAQITAALSALSRAQFQAGQYAASERNAMEALALDSTSIVHRTLLYTAMASKIMLGEKTEAVKFFDRYDTHITDIADENFQQKLSEMEVQYETAKKEAQIEALQKERELFVWMGIAIAALALLAVALLIVRQRLAVQRRRLAETQLAKLEQEQQLMAAQAVMEGEAAERIRLARDLHDGLGGMLSAVKLNMKSADEQMDTARRILEQSIRELHRVVHNLMPEELVTHGLKTSLEEFCASVPGVEFHYFGDDARLDGRLEVLIYRCAHELVNNAVKHANAKHIYVQIVKDDERISLTVQDDGTGFDPENAGGGIGLNNLRNRISVFGGRMEIYSSAENGTEVFVEIALI